MAKAAGRSITILKKRLAVAVSLGLVAALVQVSPAAAATCQYKSQQQSITLSMRSESVTISHGGTPSGAIFVNGTQCSTATLANTTSISVTGSMNTDEHLTLNMSNGVFSSNGSTEIAISIDLRTASVADSLTIAAPTAGANITFGETGIDSNNDGDVDITAARVQTYTVNAGANNDAISAAGSTATGAVFTAPVNFNGNAGDDTLTGGSANDTLNGGLGGDTLRGGAGNDTENGGDGNDTFIQGAAANGGDILNGGIDTDTVDYSARTSPTNVTLDGSANDGASGEADNVMPDIEHVRLGNPATGTNTVVGDADPNIIFGGAGADDISGGDGDDRLIGFGGNDILDGGFGNDILSAGAGDDILRGGLGTDSLIAGDGNDTLEGSDDNDALNPGPGNDSLDGGAGTDIVEYTPAPDGITLDLSSTTGQNIHGDGSDFDTIVSSSIEDVRGSHFGDTITGNAAANSIFGWNGNDMLIGGGGDDRLTGGAGDDHLEGGNGTDRCDGQGGTNTAAAPPSCDSIANATAV